MTLLMAVVVEIPLKVDQVMMIFWVAMAEISFSAGWVMTRLAAALVEIPLSWQQEKEPIQSPTSTFAAVPTLLV